MRDGPDPVRLSAKGGAVRRLVLVVAVVPAVSLLGASAAALPARPHWAITDLAASTGWSGEAQLINERGRIAGVVYGTTTYQPFLWDRGRTTLLGTLRGTTNASPIAINERGDVIGFATTKRGAFRGFVWRTGGMIDLGTLGGRETSPSDENDRGDIVGWSKTRSGQMHAFLWRNGKMRDLGAGAASAVDEQGRVVGSTRYGTNTRAWLWENGTKTDLGSLGGADVHPSVLNERRVVAGLGTTASPADGWHAFLWENGRMRDLGTLPGGSSSMVAALNEHGAVVGWSFPSSGESHAVLWRNGAVTDLGNGRYDSDSFASSINEHGQVVGSIGERAELGRDEATDAFVWQNGRRTLLPTLGGPQTGASRINDRGQIVGSSTVRGGAKHPVLWTLRG